jgi:hypothetical protein
MHTLSYPYDDDTDHGDAGFTPPPPGLVAGMKASQIAPQRVRWLSRGRLAYGMLTMLDGDGGLGKSTVTVDIAARLTTGRPLFGLGQGSAPASVIIVAPEDSEAHTIVPRLMAAAADLSRVRLLTTVPKQNGKGDLALVLPAHTAHLRHAIEQDHAVLLILDPIMSLFGRGVDTHKDDSGRRARRPLLETLAATGCAGLAVRHVTKHGGSSAAMRGMGSVAFKNVARFVLYLDHHPWDLDKLALGVAKANIGKPVPALAFQLHDTANPDVQTIEWDPEPLPLTADTLLAASTNPEQREIIRVLAEYQRPLTPEEIARALGREGDYSPLRHRLRRMLYATLLVSPQAGSYALPSTIVAPQHTRRADDTLDDTDDTEPDSESEASQHASVSSVSSDETATVPSSSPPGSTSMSPTNRVGTPHDGDTSADLDTESDRYQWRRSLMRRAIRQEGARLAFPYLPLLVDAADAVVLRRIDEGEANWETFCHTADDEDLALAARALRL